MASDPKTQLEEIAKKLNQLLEKDPSLLFLLTTKFACDTKLINTKCTLSFDGNYYATALSAFNYCFSTYEGTDNIVYYYLDFQDNTVQVCTREIAHELSS